MIFLKALYVFLHFGFYLGQVLRMLEPLSLLFLLQGHQSLGCLLQPRYQLDIFVLQLAYFLLLLEVRLLQFLL